MLKDISIEYAHIYTNQSVSEEHQSSLHILSGLRAGLGANETSALVVMVDDYSSPDPAFDYAGFSSWLQGQGHGPDLLIRESQLIPVCDAVLGLVQKDALKQQITDYIKTKKYPCSLFIAAWYLLRLGRLTAPTFPESLKAKRLINILPESFKPFENKGLEIISATPHKACVDAIHYRFLPERSQRSLAGRSLGQSPIVE